MSPGTLAAESSQRVPLPSPGQLTAKGWKIREERVARSLGPPQLRSWDGLRPPLPNPFPSPTHPRRMLFPTAPPRNTCMQISISEIGCREPGAKQGPCFRHCSPPSRVPWAGWATLGTRVTLGECIHRASRGLGGRRESETITVPRGDGTSGFPDWKRTHSCWHFYPTSGSLHHLEVLPGFKPESPVPRCTSVSSLFSSMELCSCQERKLKGNKDIWFSY